MTFILFLTVYSIIALFMLHRNNWVYCKRIAMIDKDFETYKKLESYNLMMLKFWIWDINKFIKH